MNIWIGDLEANGLLDTATVIHCGVFKSVATGETIKYTPSTVHKIPEFLKTVEIIAMHNCIAYDLPLLEKLHGYKHKGQVLDTLVMSRLLNPERVGRHGLGAWGKRLGRGKPDHEDWENFTPEMLYRCSEDVEITELVYKELMKEAEIDEEELRTLPPY